MIRFIRTPCWLGIWAIFALFFAVPQTFAQETVSGASGTRAQADAAATDVLRKLQKIHTKIYDKVKRPGGETKDHVYVNLPSCTGNNKLFWSGSAWSCTAETDPHAKSFAKANLPTCSTGQVLTALSATAFSCLTPTGGAKGDTPNHGWSGTQLRFEKPNGSWGSYVNLKGPAGDDVVCP